MKFDDLDKKMRIYETAHDYCVLPGIHIVTRLDGRNFTKLTKETHQFQTPYDIRFRDLMIETTKHLMQCGFKIIFAYTQSDEISLLFHLEDNGFHRKERKLISILAAEASAKFSLLLSDIGIFDCRVIQLPSHKLAVDYFRWRNEDAYRNALNAHCYWLLRDQGQSKTEATNQLSGKSVAFKNQLLFDSRINFNDLPSWQKRGVGLYWESYQKKSTNPTTGAVAFAERRRIHVELELPKKDAFSLFLSDFIQTYS